jgi:hypothetical protein
VGPGPAAPPSRTACRWATSAFDTTASAGSNPASVTTPSARPSATRSSRTGEERRTSTPTASAARARAATSDAMPPRTPNPPSASSTWAMQLSVAGAVRGSEPVYVA